MSSAQAAGDQHSGDDVNKDKTATEPTLSEKEKQLQDENQKLTEKVVLIDDKYKRALAESENMRMRLQRQIEEAKVFGIQSFSKDLLEVADILGMAVQSVSKDTIDSSDNPVLKSLFEGVAMTEKQLQTVFRRHGIIQINPIGHKFDPNEHHAIFEAEDPTKEPGTVSVVTKTGYKLKERTIRPAMVGVIKASNV
jgi:molecular chaperone GrpE